MVPRMFNGTGGPVQLCAMGPTPYGSEARPSTLLSLGVHGQIGFHTPLGIAVLCIYLDMGIKGHQD